MSDLKPCQGVILFEFRHRDSESKIGGQGKRVPMYKLDFQYDETRHTLSCEFTQGHTHGTWEYKVDGDSMDGTGIVLPGKPIARRVKVKRVREDQLPAAPDRDAYGP